MNKMKNIRLFILLALLLMMEGVTMQAQVRSEMYELLPESRSIKVGDVNNDGFADVVVSRFNSLNNEVIFSIYLNDGEGHLECHENISSSKPSLHMCYEQPQLFFLLEDFNLDGSIDIASYVYADQEGMLDDTCYFRINYNNGYGRFDRFTETALILPEVIWWNNQPYYLNNPYYLGLVSGDFNGDSFPDVAVANDYHSNTFSALGYAYNDGTGNFDTDFSLGSLHVPVVSDLNNDSKDDIVDGANIIYSTDSLIPRYEYLHPNAYDGYSSNGMVVFDIDGDGWKDVVEGRSDYNSHLYSHLWVFKNLGDETFQKMDSVAFSMPITGYDISPNTMKLVNYNGDEYPDIIIQLGDYRIRAGYWGYYVFEGNGTFEFGSPVYFPLENETNEFVRHFDVCDLNDDGFDDLLVMHTKWTGESWLEVFMNDGYGFDAIEENDSDSAVTCSPNPANDYVYINGTEAVEVKVYNTLGQLVKETKENVIDLSAQEAGTYILKVITPSGVVTKQIIKN